MRTAVLLFFFCLQALFAEAQITRVIKYYDLSTKKNIKEDSYVMSEDTGIRHGTFTSYLITGMPVEEAFYQYGSLRGKRIIRDRNTGLLTSVSSFINENDNWFLKFRYDDSNRLAGIDHENNMYGNVTQAKSFSLYRFLIDSLYTMLVESGASQDSLYRKVLQQFDFTSEEHYLKHEPGYQELNTGDRVLYALTTLSCNWKGYRDNEERIRRFQTRAETWCQRLPGVCETKIRPILKSIENYLASDSAEFRFYEGYRIAKPIRDLEPLLDRYLVVDSTVNLYKTLIEGYYQGGTRFPVLYEQKVKPVMDRIPGYQAAGDSIELRVELGHHITLGLAPYVSKYSYLQIQDSLINRRYGILKHRFDSAFSGEKSKDIHLIGEMTAQYLGDDSLDRKFDNASVILKKLEAAREHVTTLQDQKAVIERTFPPVSEYYKNVQPNIYRMEVDPLQSRLGEWKRMEDMADRIRLGQEVTDQCSFLFDQIDSLKKYDAGIQEGFSNVKSVYLKTYKKIFYKEIAPSEIRIVNYRSIATTREKLKTGRELLAWINELLRKYDILNSQIDQIGLLIKKNDTIYKDEFPVIAKKELGAVRESYEDYKDLDLLDTRIDLGVDLITHLRYMRSRADSVFWLDRTISHLFPVVKSFYTDDFPAIYKAEIIPLAKQKDAFPRLPTVKGMLQSGKEIVNRLTLLQVKSETLASLGKEIKSENNRFKELYRKAKDKKVIYKKGREVYKYYYRQYKSEKMLEAAIDKGKDVVLLMKKINSLSGEDPGFLQQQLNGAVTPEDIRKTFGI